MEIVDWEISLDQDSGHFDIRRTDGRFRCAAYDVPNLIRQLEPNGFDKQDCWGVIRQLSETGKAKISIEPLGVHVRQVDLCTPISLNGRLLQWTLPAD